MGKIEAGETGSPRRLIDIPRPNSKSVVLDLTEAIIINRELALISMRTRTDYEGMPIGNNMINVLLFICSGDRYVIVSNNDEDVYREQSSKGKIKKVPIRIRPTQRGRDKPTRIYLDEEMRFDCETIDIDRGEIGIDVFSTSPLVIEGAKVEQDFRRILEDIEQFDQPNHS